MKLEAGDLKPEEVAQLYPPSALGAVFYYNFSN